MSKKKTNCSQVTEFYYDFMHGDYINISTEVIEHMSACSECSCAMQHMKDSFENDHSNTGGLIDIFTADFRLAGIPVSCNHVKPFLPFHGILSRQFRFPTPVLSHVEHCPSCQHDVLRIEEANLEFKQLISLSDLFARRMRYSPNNTSPGISTAVDSLAKLNYAVVDSYILEVCCYDPQMRLALETAWIKQIALLKENSTVSIPYCKNITSSDIFDVCFPFNYYDDMEKKPDDKTLLHHFSECPVCLERVVSMSQLIRPAINRPATGILTTYTIQNTESSDPQEIKNAIHVEVSDKTEIKQDYTIKTGVSSRPRYFSLTRMALAASILLIVTLFVSYNMKPLDALDTDTKAVVINNPAYNNFIRTIYTSKESEGFQKLYVSNDLKYRARVKDNEIRLTNLSTGRTYIKDILTGQMTSEPMDKDYVAMMLKQPLIPSPFHPLESVNIPTDGVWTELDTIQDPGTKMLLTVHRLTWNKTVDSGIQVAYKWIGYFDENQLPVRTERYEKGSLSDEFVLTNRSQIEYTTREEMKTWLNDVMSGQPD